MLVGAGQVGRVGQQGSGGVWWNDAANNIDAVAPTLFADQKNNRYMLNGVPVAASDIYTVSSAAGSTYINQNGVMQTAGANTLRVDYTNGVGELLAEGAATNLILNSNNLVSGGGWSVINATRATGPTFIDGTSSYCEIATSTSGNPRVQQSITLVISSVLVLSTIVRAGTAPRFSLCIHNGGGGAVQGAKFDISGAGAIFTTSASTTASIVKLPNGDYFVQTSFTTGVANPSVVVGPDDGVSGLVFPSGTTSGLTIYTCGVQAEVGTVATSLIPTAGSTVTRTADTITLTAAAYTVLSGTSGAVAARGVYPALAAASSRLVAYGSTHLIGPRTGTLTQAENFNGTSSVFASAGSGTWPVAFGTVASWNAGNRSICFNGGTVTNDANGRGTAAAITIGPSSGMQAGQIIRLQQLVGWTLTTIGTNAQLQAQARVA